MHEYYITTWYNYPVCSIFWSNMRDEEGWRIFAHIFLRLGHFVGFCSVFTWLFFYCARVRQQWQLTGLWIENGDSELNCSREIFEKMAFRKFERGFKGCYFVVIFRLAINLHKVQDVVVYCKPQFIQAETLNFN